MQKVEGLLNVRGVRCEFQVDLQPLLDLGHLRLMINMRLAIDEVSFATRM